MEEKGDYNPEEEVVTGNWNTPKVSLKEVDVKTGEEDETLFWSGRSKLYRWVNGEWKERGLGESKLLKHKEKGTIRFLLRQEKTLKIVANHFIYPTESYCKLVPNAGSEKIYAWTVKDFAEEPRIEQFALKFNTPEAAKLFKQKFDEAGENNKKLMNLVDEKGEVKDDVKGKEKKTENENEKEKEKEKEKGKEKEKEKDTEKDKDKDQDTEKDKDTDKGKVKETEKTGDKKEEGEKKDDDKDKDTKVENNTKKLTEKENEEKRVEETKENKKEKAEEEKTEKDSVGEKNQTKEIEGSNLNVVEKEKEKEKEKKHVESQMEEIKKVEKKEEQNSKDEKKNTEKNEEEGDNLKREDN